MLEFIAPDRAREPLLEQRHGNARANLSSGLLLGRKPAGWNRHHEDQQGNREQSWHSRLPTTWPTRAIPAGSRPGGGGGQAGGDADRTSRPSPGEKPRAVARRTGMSMSSR